MGSTHKASTIIHDGQDKPKAKKERHYVDNKAFYQALVERKALVDKAIEDDQPIPKVSEFIGECIFRIADNLSKKYNFASLSFREDMVGQAIIHCLSKIDGFDPEVSKNPFSYFTQTCYYEFLGIISNERTEKYVKYKSIVESSSLNELATLDSKDSDGDALNALNSMDMSQEYMDDFIRQFEEKNPPRKKGQKRKTRRKADPLFDEDKS